VRVSPRLLLCGYYLKQHLHEIINNPFNVLHDCATICCAYCCYVAATAERVWVWEGEWTCGLETK
jgi:hypothetical protein